MSGLKMTNLLAVLLASSLSVSEVLGIDCGCPHTCTPDALAEINDAHDTCGARIQWLMKHHDLPEANACAIASKHNPFSDEADTDILGDKSCSYEACHPEGCGSTLPNDNNREYDGIFVEMEREQRLKDGIYTAASAPQHQTKHTKSENSDGSSILFNFLSFLTGSVVVVIGFVYKSRRRPTRTPATSNNEVVEDENTTEVIFPKQDSLIVPRTPPRRGSFGSFKREINAICSDSDYDSEADDSGADDDVSVEDVPEWLSAIS
uniref:Uncharacterized protein n=1 Tax=Ditylum brightwellii TaxID=49249 RepID=A0A7S1ZPY7_9STRA